MSSRASKKPRTVVYDQEYPVYIWVAYDALSYEQKAALPTDIQVQVANWKQKLAVGIMHLPDHSEPIIVIGQNVSNSSDLKCSLHSNPPYRNPTDGLSAPQALILPTRELSRRALVDDIISKPRMPSSYADLVLRR